MDPEVTDWRLAISQFLVNEVIRRHLISILRHPEVKLLPILQKLRNFQRIFRKTDPKFIAIWRKVKKRQ